jgi:hypothetical protein
MPYIYCHKHYRTTNSNAVLLFLFLVVYEFNFLPKSKTVYRSNCKHAMQAQMGSTRTALLVLNFWVRYRCMVNTMPQLCKCRGCNFTFLSQVQHYILTVVVQTHQLLNIPITKLLQLHSASSLTQHNLTYTSASTQR